MLMANRDLDHSHARPDGATDLEVHASGKMSEAFETIEKARGVLYEFHQLIGRSDRLFGEAADLARSGGHPELADRIEQDLIGLNVLAGRWSFQVVEEFDDGYYATARRLNQAVTDELVGGRQHVYEAEMKQRLRTQGHPGHEATPDEVSD
jgi:hypothetical protein